MKCFIIFLGCLISTYAEAEVQPYFSTDIATLVIQGSDSDANNLFNAMNVQSSVNGNIIIKQISYTAMFGGPVFDLSCRKSQLTENASCTLKFFSPEAVINRSYQSVLMGINDRFDAPRIAKLFNNTTSSRHSAEVFLSIDRKLRVWKTFDSSGEVVSFTMSYN